MGMIRYFNGHSYIIVRSAVSICMPSHDQNQPLHEIAVQTDKVDITSVVLARPSVKENRVSVSVFAAFHEIGRHLFYEGNTHKGI
jgi:hypothetical protein